MKNVFDFLKEKEAKKYIETFKEWLKNQSYDMLNGFSTNNDAENTTVRVNGYVYKHDDRTLQAINYLYQNGTSFDYTAENVDWSGASYQMEGILVQSLSFDVQYSGSQTNVRIDLIVNSIHVKPNARRNEGPYFTIAPSTTEWAHSHTVSDAGPIITGTLNVTPVSYDSWTTMAASSPALATAPDISTMEMTAARATTSYTTASSLDADNLVSGITAEIRATPQPGQLRMNEETNALEFYSSSNSSWQRVSSSDLSITPLMNALPSHTHEAPSTGTVGYIN